MTDRIPQYIRDLARELGITPGPRRETEPDDQPGELPSQQARARMIERDHKRPAGGHEKDQA